MRRKSKRLSRRDFLSRASGYAAGALGGGLLSSTVTACGGSTTASEPPDRPDTPTPKPTAVIDGPTAVSMLSLGVVVTAEYDGSGSRNVATREWFSEVEGDPFQLGKTSLGSEERATAVLTRPTTYIVTLETRRGRESATAEYRTVVSPPPPPSTPYGETLALFSYTREGNQAFPTLTMTRAPSGGVMNRIVKNGNFQTNSLGWDREGRRLVFSRYGGVRASNVYVYNVIDDTLTQVTADAGIKWMTTFNPRRNCIAGVDDTRIERNASDELFLVNPDTLELTYLSGDVPNRNFYGAYPSWNDNGEELALGSTRFGVDTNNRAASRMTYLEEVGDDYAFPREKAGLLIRDLRRIGSPDLARAERALSKRPRYVAANSVRSITIYRNLWDGDSISKPEDIERTRLTTDEQIGDFVRDSYPSMVDKLLTYVNEGVNGLSWSPDGKRIAYNMILGLAEDTQQIIVSTGVSTGDIRMIATDFSVAPCWSPDGQYIFFGRQLPGGFSHIIRVPAEGGTERDLSASSGPEAIHTGPAWYR